MIIWSQALPMHLNRQALNEKAPAMRGPFLINNRYNPYT